MSTEGFTMDVGDTAEASAAPATRRARAARTPAREAAREAPRDNVVRGRDGEILTRRRRDSVDPYEVPGHLIPEGWTYQWNAVSVIGNTDIVLDKSMGFYENGWRPVPAERHPGMFVPYGTKGEILRGGLRLEERPKSLTEDAQAEQVALARQQMQIQSESVMGRMAKALPNGFAAPNTTQRRSFKTGGDNLRISIDKGLDIPAAGNYTLADPE